jgi:hypothetical protein
VITKHEGVNLTNIGGGAAVELFEQELSKVLDNVLDPNTAGDAVREITVKVKIRPDAGRSFGQIEVTATSKLAPFNGAASTVFFGRNQGVPSAVQQDPHQGDLFVDDPENPKLTAVEGGAQP